MMVWRNSPSRRSIRNQLAFMGGATEVEQAKPRKRGPQPEGAINKAVAAAGRIFGAVLWRNRRGMLPLPNGGMLPFGIGPHGATDFVGYKPTKITEAMLGRTIAVASFIECKTDDGIVAPHQQAFIDEVKAHGAIAGVARNGEDVRTIIQEWECRHG